MIIETFVNLYFHSEISNNFILILEIKLIIFNLRKRAEMVATQQKAAEKLTAKAVGREFVRQYYTMLAKEPRFLHRFYGSSSEMMHGNKDDQFPAVGQSKIREKIKSLNFKDCHTKVGPRI